MSIGKSKLALILLASVMVVLFLLITYSNKNRPTITVNIDESSVYFEKKDKPDLLIRLAWATAIKARGEYAGFLNNLSDNDLHNILSKDNIHEKRIFWSADFIPSSIKIEENKVTVKGKDSLGIISIALIPKELSANLRRDTVLVFENE